MALPSKLPCAIEPPYIARPGIFIRAKAIAAAGIVLSQPHNTSTASKQWPFTASSMESAITSRETKDARIPDVPIAIPSVTAMVLNSIGVPPAARIPALACSANSRRFKLHGEIFDQVCTTATIGLAISSSDNPVARNMARAGARSGPVLMASLRKGFFMFMRLYFLRVGGFR